jgi:hypothetical protein
VRKLLFLASFLLLSVTPGFSQALAIGTTNRLPTGFLGTPYAINLTAMFGTPPYSWSKTSGSYPTGLTLADSGIAPGTTTINTVGSNFVVGDIITATQAGATDGVFKVTGVDVNGGVTSISDISPGLGYTVANGLSTTWTPTGGGRTGLKLNITALGKGIVGTPTVAGAYTVGITVTDSLSATVTIPFNIFIFDKTLDAYGGVTSRPCTSGAAAHFYTQKMGNRWYLCTPAGNAFWMNGIFGVSTNSGTDYQGVNAINLRNTKYGTTNAWADQTLRRLRSWGFNTLAIFSNYVFPPYTIAHVPYMPYIAFARPSYYALTNNSNYLQKTLTPYNQYGVKDMMQNATGQGVKSTTYSGYRWVTMDYWDPNFESYLKGQLNLDTDGSHAQWSNVANDYAVGIEVDQEDELGGMGAGPNIVGEGFPTILNGAPYAGTNYEHYHLGWAVLVTSPTQTSNTGRGITSYADTEVHTKTALSTWLSTRYGASIAALNTAWGSNYSIFGASGGGWGVGTGVLDEDGKCPSKITTCWIPTDAINLTGIGTTMKADLDAFMLYHLTYYFAAVKDALTTVGVPLLYLGPDSVGSWGTVPRRQVLQAETLYADVLSLGAVPPACNPDCADAQSRVDFAATYGGDKPWINWEGYMANPDSYMSNASNPNNSGPRFLTQPLRGGYWQNMMVPEMFNTCDTAGTCHNVGYKFWDWMDSTGANWGLVTPRDDPYDGASTSITQTYDPWGYPSGCVTGYGCEEAAYAAPYGNFLGPVTTANLAVLSQMGQTIPTVASLSASAWAFSSLVGAASATLTVTLSNTSTTVLNIASIGIVGTGYSFTTTCGSTLAGESSCTATVTFTPTMKAVASAPFTGTLTFTTDSNPNPVQTVTLSGTAGATLMLGGKVQ